MASPARRCRRWRSPRPAEAAVSEVKVDPATVSVPGVVAPPASPLSMAPPSLDALSVAEGRPGDRQRPGPPESALSMAPPSPRWPYAGEGGDERRWAGRRSRGVGAVDGAAVGGGGVRGEGGPGYRECRGARRVGAVDGAAVGRRPSRRRTRWCPVTVTVPAPPLSPLSMAPPSRAGRVGGERAARGSRSCRCPGLSPLSMAPPSGAVSSVKVIWARVIVAPGPASPLSMAPPSPVAVLSAWDMVNPCSTRKPAVVDGQDAAGAVGGALRCGARRRGRPAVAVEDRCRRPGRGRGSTVTGTPEVVLVRSTVQLPV